MDENSIIDMIEKAREARDNAYAPYSGFFVGAAVLAQSGKIYTGCNIENASYGLTICAERVAISKAISQGEREIRAIAIVAGDEIATPCGSCLQVMQEFAPKDDDLNVILASQDGLYQFHDLKDHLPLPFILKKEDD